MSRYEKLLWYQISGQVDGDYCVDLCRLLDRCLADPVDLEVEPFSARFLLAVVVVFYLNRLRQQMAFLSRVCTVLSIWRCWSITGDRECSYKRLTAFVVDIDDLCGTRSYYSCCLLQGCVFK